MILAAGRGERLKPLTERVPKPLLPIGGEPLIVHQLRWLAGAGIREVVINLHHLGELIERRLGSGRDFGVTIAYSREAELLDTGGGVRNALPLLGDAPFVLLNGDIWTDYAFASLPPAPPDDCLAHLVVTPKPDHLEAGDFDLAGGRIRRDAARPYTYAGIAVLTPALLAQAPSGAFSLTELWFPAIPAGRISGELFTGRWIDIGTPSQLEALRRITD